MHAALSSRDPVISCPTDCLRSQASYCNVPSAKCIPEINCEPESIWCPFHSLWLHQSGFFCVCAIVKNKQFWDTKEHIRLVTYILPSLWLIILIKSGSRRYVIYSLFDVNTLINQLTSNKVNSVISHKKVQNLVMRPANRSSNTCVSLSFVHLQSLPGTHL